MKTSLRLFVKAMAGMPLMVPLLARVSRSGCFPHCVWEHLAIAAGADFKPKAPTRIKLRLPSTKKTMTLLVDWEDNLGRHLYLCGTYEPETTAFMCQLLNTSKIKVVYDIGSNVGYYAMLSALLLKKRGVVKAFEPVPWIFERLEVNRRLNNLINLTCHSMAIGEKSGRTTLFLPHGMGAWSTNATRSPELSETFHTLFSSPKVPIGALDVPVETLDLLIQKGMEPPDLIRMDIEGGEWAALQGMAHTLADYSPDFIIEMLAESRNALHDFLKRFGYTAHPIGKGNCDWYATRKPAGQRLRAS